jgi:cytidylate kinase
LILGITGTDGSGKDTLGNMLAKQYGWRFISVTEILRTEAKQRKIPLTRENLRAISAHWRRQLGLGVLVDKALEKYKVEQQAKNLGSLAIASLRNPGEVDRIHELGGKVIWIDADPHVRFERIMSRKRGQEDDVTFEQFMAEEKTQSQHSGDEATLNLSGVKAKADIFINNNSNDIEEFNKIVKQALAEYL